MIKYSCRNRLNPWHHNNEAAGQTITPQLLYKITPTFCKVAQKSGVTTHNPCIFWTIFVTSALLGKTTGCSWDLTDELSIQWNVYTTSNLFKHHFRLKFFPQDSRCHWGTPNGHDFRTEVCYPVEDLSPDTDYVFQVQVRHLMHGEWNQTQRSDKNLLSMEAIYLLWSCTWFQAYLIRQSFIALFHLAKQTASSWKVHTWIEHTLCLSDP